jgi:phospholipase A1 protein A
MTQFFLKLFSSKNASITTNFTYDQIPDILKSTSYNKKITTSVYTFGSTETSESTTVKQIIAAYRTIGTENLILVDWSAYNTESDKTILINSAIQIGDLIGYKLWYVFAKDLSKFKLVGHSIGAHLSGSINRGVQLASNKKQKVPIIIALDPAGPGFYNTTNNNSALANALVATDADIVHVIHTDNVYLGAPVKVGTADFYPNGGNNQTGCPAFDMTNPMSPTSEFIIEIFLQILK